MADSTRFCRYRSMNGLSADWVRDSIVHSKHHFANPLTFNDPFDCRPHFEIRGSNAVMRKYFEGVVARQMPHLGRDARREEARRRVADPALDPRVPGNMIGFRKTYHNTVTSNIGVMCISEVHDDLLMWAHYGDSHRGVCLDFNVAEEFFATAQPVHYEEDRPHVNPAIHSHEEMLDAALYTKSRHWSYEREWRIVQYKAGAGVYTVPSNALVQVILGAEISDTDAKLIRKWALQAPAPVSVISAKVSPTNFRLDIPDLWRGDA